jgi:integrase
MPKGRPTQGPKLVRLHKKGWKGPTYYIRWTEGSRTRERTTGTSERIEAEKIFANWLLERGTEHHGPRYPAEASIADMLKIYADGRAPDLSAPERVGYAIDRLCDWWGDRRVDAVRPETCRQYRRVRVRAGTKEATAARELTVLRAALNWAVKNGYLTSAPFVQLPPKQPGRDRWLTRPEAARLLWESRRQEKARLHLPLFILIALYTGARREAILSLCWTQVDLVAGRINFNEPGRQRTNESEFARPSYGRAGSVERTREGSRSRRRGEGLAYGVFYFWELSTTGEIATLAMAMSGANGGRACCGQWLGRGC